MNYKTSHPIVIQKLFELNVYDLTLFVTPMLLALCWCSPHDLKMLMKDFKLSLSQLGSSDMFVEFYL
jgi:hypothetical protein